MSQEIIKKFRVGCRNVKCTGAISVAAKVLYPEDKNGLYEISYGASFCSPTEKHYIKKVGYELAETRLNTPNSLYTGKFNMRKLTHSDVKLKVMCSLALDPNIPSWAINTIWDVIYYEI